MNNPNTKPQTNMTFEPTRDAGLSRLAAFAEQAGEDYAQQRNYDRGPQDRRHVSVLSPWIRHRLVREPEVLAGVLEQHSPGEAEKFIQEVYWRSYFKGWFEQHPAAWPAYRHGLEMALNQLEKDRELADRYRAAVEGRTGIDCFDAWSGELVDDGYLHNHARMWFASIWVFTLKLPWELGADFFLRHLLDGDPASNTLGWRWVCGLHTRGKTYLARASNIARFTEGRFNPSGQLATEAPALKEDPAIADRFEPIEWQTPEIPPEFGLLITGEDCHAESLGLPAKPISVLGLSNPDPATGYPVSAAVSRFTRGAVADSLSRMGEVAGIEAPAAGSEALIDRGKGKSWGETLLDWTQQYGLRTVLTAYAPTGPVAEALTASESLLAEHGVQLLQISRTHDRRTWPHAGRGFFKLKKQIPGLLSEGGLAR